MYFPIFIVGDFFVVVDWHLQRIIAFTLPQPPIWRWILMQQLKSENIVEILKTEHTLVRENLKESLTATP
jgi:hypothetical protein